MILVEKVEPVVVDTSKLSPFEIYMREAKEKWEKEEQRLIASGTPIGTCSYCQENKKICSFSCVGL